MARGQPFGTTGTLQVRQNSARMPENIVFWPLFMLVGIGAFNPKKPGSSRPIIKQVGPKAGSFGKRRGLRPG